MSHFDPRDRELCVDGGCIGLVGQDGYCRECGKPGASAALDPRRRGLRDESDIMEELDEHIIKGDMMPAPEGFEDRRLCPDGACIGLLDQDGRCRQCGTIGGPATHRADGAQESNRQSGAPLPARIGNDSDRDIDIDSIDTDIAVSANGNLTGDTESTDESKQFDDRRLCSDGACIGLIGSDGHCRECGLPG